MMKTHAFFAIAACSAGLLLAPGAVAQDKAKLDTLNKKASYGMGLDFGKTWKQRDAALDLDALFNGIRDGMEGKEPLLTDAEARDSVRAFTDELRTKIMERRKILGEKAKTEGEAFLAENQKKSGVITLPSGLQYSVLREGTGKTPTTNDLVTVHYSGTLVDGTEFDSSRKRGQPATFGVTGVISGWTEALLKMKEGAQWKLFIPAGLAYKDQGKGMQIPPNSALVFDVELISTQTREAPRPISQPVTSDIIKVPSAEELKKGAQIEIIKDPNAVK